MFVYRGSLKLNLNTLNFYFEIISKSKTLKMKKLLFLSTFILLIFLIFGCHSSRYVVRERPIEPHYVLPMSPGPNYIWHNGDWVWNGNGYIYRRGSWIIAPSNRRHYISGYWQRKRGGWVWRPGYWRY